MGETNQDAAAVHGQAQQIVAHAAFTQDVARPLGEILRALPDDSSLTTQNWNQLIGAWRATRDQTRSLSLDLTRASTFFAATLSSALTTSLTVSLSFSSRAVDSAPFRQLQNVFQRPTLLREAQEILCAFGLHQGEKGSRSPSELIAEAHTALSQPSGPLTSPASVLIPARESLNQALAIVLRRIPRQEPANKRKVASIGSQCGLAGLDADHFARLDTDLTTLLDRLSGSKQAVMERDKVALLFDQVLEFHKALLTSLDRTKLQS